MMSARIFGPDGVELTFYDALSRTVEKLRGFGAQVVVVGSVPEIDYDVPSTFLRTMRGFSQIRPVLQADFERRQRIVLDALAKLEASGTAKVLYPHGALCDGRTCEVVTGTMPLYSDDDHLSGFGALRVVRSLAPHLLPHLPSKGG